MSHGFFEVNGKKVNIPSYQVSPGDVICVREKSRKMTHMIDAVQSAQRRGLAEWLEVEPEKFQVTVKMLPVRSQITMPMNEQLVVELYSK